MADLTAQSGAPTVTFDDTSIGGVDWRIRVDPNDQFTVQRYATVLGVWNSKFTLTSGDATFHVPVILSQSSPTLTFADTDAADQDYRVKVDGDGFSIDQSDSAKTTFEPALQVDPSRFVSAAAGFQAGHDASTSSHVICWKRGSRGLGAGEVANGYFDYELTDNNPAEWVGKTIGATVMMADTGTPSTFQSTSWKAGTAAGTLSVQVIHGGGVYGGDIVRVTFDTTYYAATSVWHILACYTP